ncbi:MAG: DUF4367 domain-containing protein [Defluviitaleaceae bacterium]|nr:DUF4367 domain-containing protein [Defluviitaleaceae bacterium]
MDNEKLFDAIIKVAAEEAWQEESDSLPSLEELNEMYPPSETLDKRVYGAINKATRRGKIKKTIRYTIKCAMAFCVFIVFAGGALMSVEASRTFILSRIINISDDYARIHFQLGYVSDLEIGELVINYIPDDFTFYEQGEFTEGHTFYTFRSETRRGIMIQHFIVSEGMNEITSGTLMTEGGNLSVISLNGQVAYFFTFADENYANTISLNDGRHFLSVTAFLDRDELIKIAKGMTLR